MSTFEAERQIVRTMCQYAEALDYGHEASEFLDCFLEDAIWWSSVEGQWAGVGGVSYSGHRELRAWFDAGLPSSRKASGGAPPRGTPGALSKHVFTTPDIRLTADRAAVQSYCLGIREGATGPLLYSMGRYLDQFMRCKDGRWRIRERHYCREAVVTSAQTRPAG